MKKKETNNNRHLTRSEFQVMKVLWTLPKSSGFVNDILKEYPEPKPAYTTLSTFLKILKEKGIVKSMNIGNLLYYTAIVSREEYTLYYMNDAKETFFEGSLSTLIRFYAERDGISEAEKEEIAKILNNKDDIPVS